MAHTPTPWETDGVYIQRVGDERLVTIANCSHSPRVDIPTAKANAEFIVRAVNSHEALLEACKRLLEELRLIRMKDSGAVYDVTCRIDAAHAIKAAEASA